MGSYSPSIPSFNILNTEPAANGRMQQETERQSSLEIRWLLAIGPTHLITALPVTGDVVFKTMTKMTIVLVPSLALGVCV